MRTKDLAPRTSKIVESVGFPNRKAGDTYHDPSNAEDVATFVKLILLPEDKPQFTSSKERDLAFEYWRQSLNKRNSKIFILNKPFMNLLAVYIVHFDVAGKQEYYVKFVDSKKTLAGKLTAIPPGIKAPEHGGYVFSSKRSTSERMPIKPSSIFSSSGPYTGQEVYNIVSKYQDPAVPHDVIDQMSSYIGQVVKGNSISDIPDGIKYQTVHEKYTGEFSAPIAVINYDVLNPDILRLAEKNITNSNFFGDAKIMYPLIFSQRLIDSQIVWPDGTKVGLSSKAGKGGGASASIEGLYDTVEKKRHDPDFQKSVIEKYPAVIDLIETVSKYSSVDALFALLLKYKVLNKTEIKILIDMLNNIKEGHPNRNTIKYLKTDRLKNFYKGYKAKTNTPGYNLLFHLTAASGKELGRRLNRLPITDAIKQILNFTALIQIYTETSVAGNNLRINGFTVVWPPVFDGEVEIDVAKSLSASAIRGKLGFKFK